MYCKKCGEKYGKEDMLCKKCGEVIPETEQLKFHDDSAL